MIHISSQNSNSVLSKYTAEQVQPNAVDLKVDKIFTISSDEFAISEDFKTHRGSTELLPVTTEFTKEHYWNLQPGTYEIIMEGEVEIGHDEAGWVVTRSTLNRNGLVITAGLYDSGYKGVMAGALHVNVGPARIYKGTRVGQFLLFKAESLTQYDGDYGTGRYDIKYSTTVANA